MRAELLRGALDGTPAITAGDSGSRYLMIGVESAIEQDLLAVAASGDTVFRHPLVRAAVVQLSGVAERRQAHSHLAELYHDVSIRRAIHLSAAATGPDQVVADLLERAAKIVRSGGAGRPSRWIGCAGPRN